jgi:hypothetical protein
MSEEKKARRLLNFGTPGEQTEQWMKVSRGYGYQPGTGILTSAPNAKYGTDIFDPNAVQPSVMVSSDPKLTQPLPDGRYIEPNFPSPQNSVRADNIKEFMGDPKQYVTENAAEAVNEQSLLDRGKSMLANLFDYQDDADLSVFGVNLSVVESVWDRALRHTVGAYDLLNIGFGGLISAAPGGVDTISYDALSGGKSVAEVLNGEMVPGSAPSPGQIAVTSVGLEAKRIREGGARLSDILLLNPATAPFILAGLAADDSPVQAEGFDLLDKEKRDVAFGSGWEQWMTGITDAGLMFADPLIGAGVAVKVSRAGMLGARLDPKSSAMFGVALDDSINELISITADGAKAPTLDEIIESARLTTEQKMATAPQTPVIDRLMAGEAVTGQALPYTPRRITTDMPEPEKYVTPMAKLFRDILLTDSTTGRKVMSVGEIASQPEFAQLDNVGTIAADLHKINDPVVLGLYLGAMSGAPNAAKRLMVLRPALADAALRIQADRLSVLRATEPAKLNDAYQMLARQRQNAGEQYAVIQRKLDELSPGGPDNVPEVSKKVYADLQDRQALLRQNGEEAKFLSDVLLGRQIIDPLDATSPYYDSTIAERILTDILTDDSVISRAVGDEIADAAQALGIKNMDNPSSVDELWSRHVLNTTTQRGDELLVNIKDKMVPQDMKLLWKDNTLSRMAAGSRERRRKGRYQYMMEGTRILPRKVNYETIDKATGAIINKTRLEGVWTPSVFEAEGTSRLRRNIRVWRWLGEKNPSGYIGLKGSATVGSEEEFVAATNLDMYKGNGIAVVDETGEAFLDEAGNPIMVGGVARREELFNIFYSALNDPTQDSLMALKRVEEMVVEDLTRGYGLPANRMQEIARKGSDLRDKTLEQIRAHGMFVDADNGTIHMVPYLKSQLANGTYMMNYQQMEKIIRRETAGDRGARLRASMATGGHYLAEADRLFQTFWRPAVLLRLSYTQRNVFEGLARAMAYNASIAPLSWPVRATANGVRNSIIKRTAGRKVAEARKAISESDFQQYWDEYSAAEVEYNRLASAMQDVPDNPTAMIVFRRDAEGELIQENIPLADYEARLQAASDARIAASGAVDANANKFAEAIKGTRFGKWREAELKDLDKEIEQRQRLIDVWIDLIGEMGPDGNATRVDNVPQAIAAQSQLQEEIRLLTEKRMMIYARPLEAMSEYQGFAARERRIGSGTSMGPDGNYYGDALTGPLEQLNRQAYSSDGTQKLTLATSTGLLDNFFQRVTVRTNTAVPYLEKNKAQWAEGMASVIEDASSNRLVQVLVNNDFDVDRTIAWMLSGSKDAERFMTAIGHQFDDNLMTLNGKAREEAAREWAVAMQGKKSLGFNERLAPLFEDVDTGRGTVRKYEPEAVAAYVSEIVGIIKNQMMGRPEFMDMLQRRIRDKSPRATQGSARDVSKAVDADEILRIVDSIPLAERTNLGFVQGSEIIQSGMESMLGLWQKGVNWMFKYLATIPEDAIVRGPFYNTRFKAARNALIESYWLEQGMDLKQIRARNRQAVTKGGAIQEGTITHPQFKIPNNELARIEVQSHRMALADTKEYIYTLDRRTNVGRYGEWLFPFVSASQNTAVVAGKLLYRNPWLAPLVADLWRMPTRVGWEDENGNLQIPMPFPFVRDFLAEHPEIPFIGGAVGENDMISFPKDGLNVWMPDTGFGLINRPSAYVQVSASELMKYGAFPVETPQAFYWLFDRNRKEGEPSTADQAYQTLKDYFFGTEGSLSEKFASYDMLLPAGVQKILASKDELSAAWGYQHALQRATQYARWRAGERPDEPTMDEINKRTTNAFWMQALGNYGVPTPLTPYPILTRPQVTTPFETLIEIQQKYQKMDPENASFNMMNQLGDWALEAANIKTTRNVGGADPSAAAVSDIRTFDGLIRKVTTAVGEGNYEMIGMLVNNRDPQYDYSQTAYDWQKSTTIPGTTNKFREIQSPEQAQAERERIVGWTTYQRFFDLLDARLAAAGFKSYEAAGAAAFKQQKETFIYNMLNNPELEGWRNDFLDVGGSRTTAAVKTIELAVMDDTFVREMVKAGKETLVGAMSEYALYRRSIIKAVEESGKSINDESNIMLKQAWANIRQDLKNRDERWAAIADRYFANDDNPTFPGDYMSASFMAEMAGGVGVG